MVLLSMYLDDATMQDWASIAVETQECVGDLMQLLGSPWAADKTQQGGADGDFLGFVHDLTKVQSGIIKFWPREALIVKVADIIALARQAGLHSGMAAKLYGICNFLETGMFARVGRAGLAAIKDRQYDHETGATPEIIASFDFPHDLLRLQPRREYRLIAGSFNRLLVQCPP